MATVSRSTTQVSIRSKLFRSERIVRLAKQIAMPKAAQSLQLSDEKLSSDAFVDRNPAIEVSSQTRKFSNSRAN
jgi:hypothetical protein